MLPVFDQRADVDLTEVVELGTVKEHYDVAITFKGVRFYCHSIYLSNNSTILKKLCNKTSQWKKEFSTRKRKADNNSLSLDEDDADKVLEINYDDNDFSKSMFASAYDFLEFLEAFYVPSRINPKYEETGFFAHLEGLLELADHFEVKWINELYDNKLPQFLHLQGAQTLWKLLYLAQIHQLNKTKLVIVEVFCKQGLKAMQFAGGVVWEKYWKHYDAEIMRHFTDCLLIAETKQQDRKWHPYCKQCQESDYDEELDEKSESESESQCSDQLEDELNDVKATATTDLEREVGVEDNLYHYESNLNNYVKRLKSEHDHIDKLSRARQCLL